MPRFNDLDLKNWKEVDILTESLWIFDHRVKAGKHNNFYHGNFIPQIPYQLIKRFTKKGDIIFDPFVGSGTTAYVAEELKRRFIGIDLNKELIDQVNLSITDNKNIINYSGDSADKEIFQQIVKSIKKFQKNKIQLAILHPPYYDIIKFSNDPKDLSNSSNLDFFLNSLKKVIHNTLTIMEKDRYLAIVIGDKYQDGQWIPLGFNCMYTAISTGLTLKSIIIKNIEGNRGKIGQSSLWRYRALTSDYVIFKHEYILIFKY